MQESEIRALLGAAEGTRMGTPVLLAAYTGMRRGELLALRWAAVDFENQCVAVREALEVTKAFGLRFKSPKSKQSRRVIPLDPAASAALEKHRSEQDAKRDLLGRAYKEHDLVFCRDDGSPWCPSAFSSAFVHVARRAKVDGFRLHDLRHAFATFILTNGAAVSETQALLGHSSARLTLDTYSHLVEGAGRAAVLRLGQALRPTQEGVESA